MRARDWAATPLGPPHAWPPALKTAVSLMLGARQPVYIAWGPELTSLYNDGYLPIVGTKHPEGFGQPFAVLWAEIWNDFQPIVAATMAGEAQHFVDLPIALAGRPELPVGYFTFSYTALRDEDGQAAGFYCAATETTATVLAERRQAGERERQRLMMQQMSGFAALLQGPEHRFDYVNDAYVAIAGGRDLLGRTVREAFPELVGQGFYELLDGVYATGERYTATDISVRLSQDGGSERHIDLLYEPIRNDHGEVVGIFAGGYDTTERVRAETALRELNETLEKRIAEGLEERRVLADLVDGTDAFVQVADRDYRWLAINRASADEFERIYGVRPTVGASMLDLLADRPDHRDAVKRVWARALSGEAFTEVSEFGDPSHDRRSYEMKYNVLRDGSGEIIGAYQFVYDVTDRIREQQRLAEAEEALRQSQKMEIVGQLTGGIAHDFNNLLMAVISNLDMMRKHAANDPRMTRMIDVATQGANRGAALTQRLLAFARRQSLKVEPADIGALVEGMRELLVRSVGPDIDLRFEVARGLPMALVDANQVELALLNLVINARDAMPDGGAITIAVDAADEKAGADLRQGRYVRLCVIDTGIGMDEETLQRAIEPFFSTKELGKGTGLGLSMIHGLASQLNGALRLTSRRGEGVKAELFLPVTDLKAQGEDVQHASGLDAPAPGKVRILVVDDDLLIRMSTSDMLVDLGHEVVEAGSGNAALDILKSGVGIDLLLTDFAMPGMNGAQLAQAVREHVPDLPILLATGYAEMPKGVDIDLPRLGKPYSQDQLAREIARLLAT